MPHLAGILDVRQEPKPLGPVLDTLTFLLRVEGVRYHERRWCDRRFGAVNLLNDFCQDCQQPVIDEQGDAILLLDGEIFNRTELLSHLTDQERRQGAPSTPMLCLLLFRRMGDRFVTLLNGQFNIAIYLPRLQQVKLFNDRLAYRPMYFRSGGGLHTFALEKKALIAAFPRPPEIDRQGLFELFAFGHNLEDRTVFEGITAMPQGAVLTFDRSGVHVSRYWQPEYCDRQGERLSLRDWSAELGRRIQNAVDLRCAGRRGKGVFLSGGLDSRCVAAALSRAAPQSASFTFVSTVEHDLEALRDVRYASQLADALGLRHHELRLADDHYYRTLSRVVWRTECALPFHLSKSIEFHRSIHGEAQLVFNGHFGDVLLGLHLLPQMWLLRDREQLIHHIITKRGSNGPAVLNRIFRKDFVARAYPELLGALRRGMARFGEDRIPALYDLWGFTTRQRRATFCSPAVDRYLFERCTPFIDNHVVDWGLKMPLRHRFAQRAYKMMILDSFPEIRHVPHARTGKTLSGGFAANLIPLGQNWVRKRLERIRSRRRGATVIKPRMLSDARFRARAMEYISSDAFLADVFDPTGIRELLDRHFDGGEDFDKPLSMLLTVAEASRLFLETPLCSQAPEARPELAELVPA